MNIKKSSNGYGNALDSEITKNNKKYVFEDDYDPDQEYDQLFSQSNSIYNIFQNKKIIQKKQTIQGINQKEQHKDNYNIIQQSNNNNEVNIENINNNDLGIDQETQQQQNDQNLNAIDSDSKDEVNIQEDDDADIQKLKQEAHKNLKIDGFICRSLLSCKNKKQKKSMKRQLILILRNSLYDKETNQIDWENYQIPQIQATNNQGASASKTNQANNDNDNDLTLEQMCKKQKNMNDKFIQIKSIKVKVFGAQTEQLQQQNLNNLNEFKQFQKNRKKQIGIQALSKYSQQQTVSVDESMPYRFSINLENESSQEQQKQQQQKLNEALKKQQQQQIQQTNQDEDELGQLDFIIASEKKQIVGTSEQLEKDYLRLTAIPDPTKVRPEHILQQSYQFTTGKYKTGKEDYEYIKNQLRSIRQDLIVQHIRTNFTIQVLESNARICLQNYDIVEFGRCVSELNSLYREITDNTNRLEFLYYTMLQQILNNSYEDLERQLRDLNETDFEDWGIQKALKIKQCIQTGNVKQFFDIYKNSEDYGRFLMDMHLDQMREWGLKILAKGCRNVVLQFLQSVLAFHNIQELTDFIYQNNSILSDYKNFIKIDY